jgi:hypothetical protein
MALPRLYKPRTSDYVSPKNRPIDELVYEMGRKAFLGTIHRERATLRLYRMENPANYMSGFAAAQSIIKIQRAQHDLAYIRKQLKAGRKAAKKQRKSA